MWAVPGAQRSELAGIADGRLRVKIAAPAHEERANRELCRFLAGVLGVPRSYVDVVAGASGRRKTVSVIGIDSQTIRQGLGL